jgi:hypothetical protein
MDADRSLRRMKRVGTGVCFIVFPLVWVVAFAAHPSLLAPRLALGPAELIRRAHGDGLLQAVHALVTVNTALLVVVTLEYMRLLDHTRYARAGLAGAAMAVLGACLLAADKGALCLTMSALDTRPEREFAAMMPGLLAIFSFKGWMALVWGLLFMPIGVMVQAVGLLRAKVLPRWQPVLLLVSLPFIGFPDGAELVNLGAAMLMTAAMLPHGVRLLRGEPELATATP